jgi:transposase
MVDVMAWRRDGRPVGGQCGRVPLPRRGYPSDLTDAQWALIEPLLPGPSTGGRPGKHPRREGVNGILYVVRSGCPWRCLPADLPPWQTVYWYFTAWEEARVTEKLLVTLRVKARVQDGFGLAQPQAGAIELLGRTRGPQLTPSERRELRAGVRRW